MTDSALLAVALAALAGIAAGRAWSASLRRERTDDRHGLRGSPHYAQALHHLSAGQSDLAIGELNKLRRQERSAPEVLHVLGNLLREAGQVDKAIEAHRALLAKSDLTRGERASGLASLAVDYRRAGFVDRAFETYAQVLEVDPRNIQALLGLQRLHEDQRQWQQAYELQTRVSRLRKASDRLVLGHLQAELGREAAAAGKLEAAERAFRTALSLDRRVLPAHLGLAELFRDDPPKAAAILEDAIAAVPERAYLVFDRLEPSYRAAGKIGRFAELCEDLIRKDARDWRARIALARHVRDEGRPAEALGLLLRVLHTNPQAMLTHVEIWKTLRVAAALPEPVERYLAAAEEALFYRDPHICTACRYRMDEMNWRCPHCHEWDTIVEERLVPATS